MTEPDGNLNEDNRIDNMETRNLKLRAYLMRELEILIHDRRLTQSDAANLLGVQQSRVSDLIRGKTDRFSIDMLVNLLAKMGHDVEMKVNCRVA